MNIYEEDIKSKIPALQLLQNLGYTYLTSEEALEERKEKRSNVILEGILERQLRKINSFEYRGKKHKFPDKNIKDAVKAIKDFNLKDGLVKTNEKVYDLLCLGKSFNVGSELGGNSYNLYYIDWKNIHNNVFHVTEEFAVTRRGSQETYRPDIVLFLNGIPVGVIECKSPTIKNPLDAAISQNIRNQKEDGIQKLFIYIQLIMGVCSNHATYATVGTVKKFWSIWREDVSEELSNLFKIINKPLPEEVRNKLFRNRYEDYRNYLEKIEQEKYILAKETKARYITASTEDFDEIYKLLLKKIDNSLDINTKSKLYELKDDFDKLKAERDVTEQDKLIYALCRPERLLELTYQFILFDGGIKKIARYQQYFAVKNTLKRIKEFDRDNKRRGGVIWHTQGSGKSLTMVFIAKAIELDPDIKNPRLIIVTDRINLDWQISKTFRQCGKDVVKAASGVVLLKLIEDYTEIITTTLHKFISAGKNRNLKTEFKKYKVNDNNISMLEQGVYSEKELTDKLRELDYRSYEIRDILNTYDITGDIFVLVDESHRSQYGSANAVMGKILPRACYVGFTGTPLMKDEKKNTVRKFGDFIDKYTIDRAVEDKAVVPLLYEGKLIPQEVDKKAIDSWFEMETMALTERQKADLKRKFSSINRIMEADQRIYINAFDISKHFEINWKGTGFKAQLTARSKVTALKFKEYLDKFGMVSTEVLISSPDMRENNEDPNETEEDEIQKFWKKMMQRYGNEEEYNNQIINCFNYDDDPEIIIVVDKLLTGFDAPRNVALYITRSLKEHTLLQAIARVNRLYENKEFGYIIDYCGLLEELDKALTDYRALEGFEEEDLSGTVTGVQEEIKKLPQRHSALWDIFKEIKSNKSERYKDTEKYERHLKDEKLRDDFYEKVSVFAKTLHMAFSSSLYMKTASLEEIEQYKKDAAFFENLKKSVKNRYADSIDYRDYEPKVKKLLDTHVTSYEVQQVIEPVNIFDTKTFEEQVNQCKTDRSKADAIASRVKKTITEKMEEDPVFYTKFSKLIQDAIDAYNEKRLSDTEYLNKVFSIKDAILNRTDNNTPERLKNKSVAIAFYGLSLELLEKSHETNSQLKDIAADLALYIDKVIQDNLVVEWKNKDDIKATMEFAIEDYLYDVIKARHNIPLTSEDMDEIIEKAMNIAKARY